MSVFVPEAVRATGPDPFKHVNYTLGMILGPADLQQDFAFHDSRLRWVTRDLLGYGTVCGLRVTAENAGSEGWQVVVGPGAGVNPRGELMRVPAPQCARLSRWLAAHREEVIQRVGTPPAAATLYVVLCYRQCPVDLVSIPGEPCRTEDDSFAPSRLQDGFQLDLRWDAPEQRQEDATRDFSEWLSQIELDDAPDSPARRADFEQAVRDAVPQLQTPPASPPDSPPDFILGSPPAALAIPRAAAYNYLRLAFRIWTTELRPLWLGLNQDCAGTPPDTDCLLLAQLRVPLTPDLLVSDVEPVTVDEERRPYLIPLRLLMDWAMRGQLAAPTAPGGPVTLAGDVSGPAGTTLVEGLQGQPVPAPGAADVGRLLAVGPAGWQLVAPPAGGGGSPIVAAGRFDPKGGPIFAPFNNLAARLVTVGGVSVYFLSFDGIVPRGNYIVKATVVNTLFGGIFNTDVVDLADQNSLDRLRPAVDDFNASNPGNEIKIEQDIPLRLSPNAGELQGGLMIEVSQFG